MNSVQHKWKGLENQMRKKAFKNIRIDTGPQPWSMIMEYVEMDMAMNMKSEEFSTTSIWLWGQCVQVKKATFADMNHDQDQAVV